MRESLFDRRRAGVLLHPTSLPGRYGNGDIGESAHRFVEFPGAAGFTVWQMLPLGPTHHGGSPYRSYSAHAGNPLLIDLQPLVRSGWLDESELPAPTDEGSVRLECLRSAADRFFREEHADRAAFQQFIREQADWLEEYALFQTLRGELRGQPWWEWPADLRDRSEPALRAARERLSREIQCVCFEQFLFFSQWQELRDHAQRRGIHLFGDLPIFVAHDSADVWARPDLFLLESEGRPRWVAGVPPDYFSQDGQRWGNPRYDWQRMEEDFEWWRVRLETQLQLFDLLRVDHFRGFQACWHIPRTSETARDGHWVEVPGRALFEALQSRFDPLPLVAEDLGFITPEVHALRRQFGLPGMRILQFAFDGNSDNPYLPHNHSPDSVVYTGTHDNDTTLGWFDRLDGAARDRLWEYLGRPHEPMPWPLIRAALRSVAGLAVIPLQDLLGLGSEHRMNVPGTVEGNWCWRFRQSQLDELDVESIARMVRGYGR